MVPSKDGGIIKLPKLSASEKAPSKGCQSFSINFPVVGNLYPRVQRTVLIFKAGTFLKIRLFIALAFIKTAKLANWTALSSMSNPYKL